MEKDEVYVPKTRSDLGLPKEGDPRLDYDEIFGDTPIYTLFMLIRQQLLAFPAYLRKSYIISPVPVIDLVWPNSVVFNVSGQKAYPKWTNHFDCECEFATQAWPSSIHLCWAR